MCKWCCLVKERLGRKAYNSAYNSNLAMYKKRINDLERCEEYKRMAIIRVAEISTQAVLRRMEK